jgi:hypothetical protein
MTHKGLQITTRSLRVIDQSELVGIDIGMFDDFRKLPLNCSIRGSDRKLALIVCRIKGVFTWWVRISVQETTNNPSSGGLEDRRYPEQTIFLH